MEVAGAAFTGGLAGLTAVLFLGVARGTARRRVSPGFVGPNLAFAAAWGALGVMMATDAIRYAVAALAPESIWYVTMMHVKVIAMAGMLAAFGAYVLYLYRGSLRRAGWLSLFAGVHAAYFLYGLRVRLPVEVIVGRWGGRAEFLGPGELWGGLLFGLAMFFLPLLALAVAYGMLWRRVPAHKRARLAAAIVCLVTFTVAGSVQANPDVSPDGPALPLAGLALFLAAALAARVFRLDGQNPPVPELEP